MKIDPKDERKAERPAQPVCTCKHPLSFHPGEGKCKAYACSCPGWEPVAKDS